MLPHLPVAFLGAPVFCGGTSDGLDSPLPSRSFGFPPSKVGAGVDDRVGGRVEGRVEGLELAPPGPCRASSSTLEPGTKTFRGQISHTIGRYIMTVSSPFLPRLLPRLGAGSLQSGLGSGMAGSRSAFEEGNAWRPCSDARVGSGGLPGRCPAGPGFFALLIFLASLSPRPFPSFSFSSPLLLLTSLALRLAPESARVGRGRSEPSVIAELKLPEGTESSTWIDIFGTAIFDSEGIGVLLAGSELLFELIGS